MIEYDWLYIGGAWTAPHGNGRISVYSASTEELVGSVPDADEADIDAAVDAARETFDNPTGWASWEPGRRADVMEAFAFALDERSGEMARRVSLQNGMPISVAQHVEGELPSMTLRYYGELARNTDLEELRPGLKTGATRVRQVPVGVVAAIVPWNAPQTLAFIKIAPAMAAGCTVVIKPSPETVLDSFLLAEAADAAGVPPGVVNVVPGGREIGAYLVAHPRIDKVSFTGSTVAGRNIGEVCGRLLRPVSLELGGKSAAIVLDDADLSAHLDSFFSATMFINGQACFASTRVLLPKSRYAKLVDEITSFVASLNVGDALDSTTQVGPLVSERQRDRVEGYIQQGLASGARLTTGGTRPSDQDRGWFVAPTIFADVDNSSTIAQEEIFGPVLALRSYENEVEAVRIANDSSYGLGGTVWTEDIDRAVAIAKQFVTGAVGVNGFVPAPNAPYGGRKASGLGREWGPEAMSGYLQYQSIYL